LRLGTKKDRVYSRFLVPGNEHGRDAHVTFELVKSLLSAGEFTVPEDFDAPLPDDVLADFEGR
jgi:hypothetical protein